MIRTVNKNDAGVLAGIYAPYVRDTAITFEIDIPDEKEFENRIENISKKYPFIVYEEDGEIMGYAYANTFKDRKAYDFCVETSVYVKREKRELGIGRILYEELELRLRQMGILNMYACLAYTESEDEYLNRDSLRFHEALGYVTVGTFRKCGYKFGRWYDMIWMEKMLGDHKEGVSEIALFDGSVKYPAYIFSSDDKYVVEVTDFGISTSDTSKDKAVNAARELLECVIESYREEGIELPKASDVNATTLSKDVQVCYFNYDM